MADAAVIEQLQPLLADLGLNATVREKVPPGAKDRRPVPASRSGLPAVTATAYVRENY